MCDFTSQLVIKRCKASEELNVEERNLLSVAFKNVVGSKRASWFVCVKYNIFEQIVMNCETASISFH